MTCFLIGVLGGCLVEFLNIYKLRTKKNWPEHYKTFKFWIPTIVMILFGGILSVCLNPTNTYLNLYIGTATPSLIERIIKGKL